MNNFASFSYRYSILFCFLYITFFSSRVDDFCFNFNILESKYKVLLQITNKILQASGLYHFFLSTCEKIVKNTAEYNVQYLQKTKSFYVMINIMNPNPIILKPHH